MAKLVTERSDVIPLLAETFRTYGFEGASLARISEVTQLGKGSIYHFFPGGKEEMAEAMHSEIDAWFQRNVFDPLQDAVDPWEGIEHMFIQVRQYFNSGRKVCLVGVFALGSERDRFASRVRSYFSGWDKALVAALIRTGKAPSEAKELSREVIGGIQGALVLARGMDQPKLFDKVMDQPKLFDKVMDRLLEQLKS
jgi:AcrR family transcriptional regulator